MAVELMAGYTAYTNAPDIIAEATGARPGDLRSDVSSFFTITVSFTYQRAV
ncbi:hypothetical protein KDL01_13595 [Actinospica durhamensis]|uniref:Uncharacterized protein n=1 Tax=Actinospica durhamensis TaxID=1508375 RepID=A0A941EUT9_9ACTN|nr:hypothetical protein [Actinospica durhamensis]MBR7834304.1 hypothetical protein [Actinospica durhamensis]